MIGYVTLGTNDLQGNAPFYDAIAKEMGVGRMMDTDSYIAWGEPGGAAIPLRQVLQVAELLRGVGDAPVVGPQWQRRNGDGRVRAVGGGIRAVDAFVVGVGVEGGLAAAVGEGG